MISNEFWDESEQNVTEVHQHEVEREGVLNPKVRVVQENGSDETGNSRIVLEMGSDRYEMNGEQGDPGQRTGDCELSKIGINVTSNSAGLARLNGDKLSEEHGVIFSSGEEMKRYQSSINSFGNIEDLGHLDLLQSQFNPRSEDQVNYLSTSTTQYQEKLSNPVLTNRIQELNLTEMKLLQDGSNLDPALGIICPGTPAKPLTTINLVGQSLPESINLHSNTVQYIDDKVINKVTDITFPAVVQEEIFNQYRTGDGYDAIWSCNGGRYRVHKLILSICSSYLQELLLSDKDEITTMISTPELNSAVVKSIICLFYTGRVNISWEMIGEVNTALKLLGFNPDTMTVTPSGAIKEENSNFDPASDYLEVELKRKRKRKNEYDSDDGFIVGDSAFDDGILGLGSEDEDWTPKKFRKRVKSETYSDDDDSEVKPVLHGSNFRRGRKSLKTPDTTECFRTRGPGKGERSYKLAQDLFEGRHSDFVYVCHSCYEYFETEKKLALHKTTVHANSGSRGEHHTANSKEFNCPKCLEIISVKHLVWFIKHLKYCGENYDAATSLIGPEDYSSDEEDNPSFKKKYSKRLPPDLFKDTADRLRITGEQKGKNVQTLSRLLVGQLVDYIWGCRTCYIVFTSADQLEAHKIEAHKGVCPPGEYWNPSSENYTCPRCSLEQNSRHLVWFIYHMRKCSQGIPQTSIKTEEPNEEEELDEDTTIIQRDPEGIVIKTYKVCNDKSEWICHALFGRSIPVLFPCHLCYTVFIEEQELRQHSRVNHPGQVNLPELGPYFDKNEEGYNCPHCQQVVCKSVSNQNNTQNTTNSIYFTFHYRKCQGQAFPVEKTCVDCGKIFNEFDVYKHHVNTSCDTKHLFCHLCTKVFASQSRLNYHVQYVHSAVKPFPCTLCEKSYKRRNELQEHEEMSHSTHFNYSCDKCGKQFYGKKNLALHMKTHYSEEEKKHVCTICGYRFAKVKFLKNHMTKHSDVRQFSCEVCGARVKTRDTLKQHRKKLHNLTTPVPKTSFILDPATGIQQTVFIKDENQLNV